MSILERIRSKSGLAIGVVGFALLMFVVSDALNTNFGIFGGKADATTVGKVAGEKIDIKFFEAKLKENEMFYKQRSQQENIDAGTQEMLREQTWNQLVQDLIMSREYEDLGIQVTNDELFDLVQGENPHEQIKMAPMFKNPQTGMFDRTYVIRFLKQLNESNDEQAKMQWQQFEDGLLKETEAKKYATLFKKGIYATNLEAKIKMTNRSRSADFEMIALNYFSVPDTSITVDESDLKSYFKKNYDKYKEKQNGRKIDFVVFDIVPTPEDTAEVKKWVSDQVAQFAAATNDTLYVDLNSETKFDTVAHPLSYYPEEASNRLFTDSVGTIVGPVYKNGKFSIYKISGIKHDTVYNMRASHILFKTDGPTKQDTLNTMKKAQEVLAEIRKGADFGEKAAQYGTDGTASRGGDLGWFTEGQMVKEFNDYVKNGKKGDMAIIKTQFGIHIVKITENKTKKLVAAGVLERTIQPSEKTANAAYTLASQFAANIAGSEENFDKMTAEKGLTKRVADNIRENDRAIAGIPDAREVVRWAFNAKTGDVSDVYTVGDKYIVALLTGIREKGKAEFENVKEHVTADYRKDKKAEQLMEKAQTAMSGGASNLQDLATKLQSNVTPINGQTFENNNIPYVGQDYIFLGTVFGTAATGKVLGPVKGNNAIFVYNLTKFNDSAAPSDPTPLKEEMQSQLSQRVEYGSFEALKELNNVEDNRYKFY